MGVFQATILTPEGTAFDGEVLGVQMPGVLGLFEVKSLHAPIISTLTDGNVLIRTTEAGEKTIRISGGFVEVNDNRLTLLAESIVSD